MQIIIFKTDGHYSACFNKILYGTSFVSANIGELRVSCKIKQNEIVSIFSSSDNIFKIRKTPEYGDIVYFRDVEEHHSSFIGRPLLVEEIALSPYGNFVRVKGINMAIHVDDLMILEN